MARHETEMHRQRDTLRGAIEAIIAYAEYPDDMSGNRLNKIKEIARAALHTAFSKADIGLFADRSQIDMQDRKDV
jgi:hypothetical protein